MGAPRDSILQISPNNRASSSLKEKILAHYSGRGRGKNNLIMTNRFATTAFLFIAISELYVCCIYVMPFVYKEYDPWTIYWLRVLACFIFIGAISNWLCCRFTNTFYEPSEDRPDLVKTLWDDHPTNGFKNGHVPFNTEIDSPRSRWEHCHYCQLDMPPRCHHCPDCHKCVLKRDHHCYMTGVCIGFYNQRYFVVMNFYVAIASIYGLYIIVKYLNVHVFPNLSYFSLFLPFTLYECLFKSLMFHELLMIIHCYFLWWTGLVAAGFFVWQIFIIVQGKTSHEVRGNIRVRNTDNIAANFRSVFGDFWLFNLIIPAQLVFKQREDGIHWEIK